MTRASPADSPSSPPTDAADQARAILVAMDAGADAPSALAALGGDFDAGLAVQQLVNRQRLARGDRPVGFKIGFTNRTIWPLYGVHAPIWAPVWQQTAHEALVTGESDPRGAAGPAAQGSAAVGPAGETAVGASAGQDAPVARFDASDLIGRLNRPRLEPEIVLGLGTVPDGFDPTQGPPSADTLARLEAAVEWVAHGFELVQSPWPDWKFGAGQAMASQSLHGALIVGPRRRVVRARGLAAALASLHIALYRDATGPADGSAAGHGTVEPVARGQGSDVLDGPIQALGHWLQAARQRPAAVEPARGMMVTTGTLTDAQAIGAGQSWRTRLATRGDALSACLDGPLVDLSIRF